jgi:hypothetical protein
MWPETLQLIRRRSSNAFASGPYPCVPVIAIFDPPHSLTIHSCVFRSEFGFLPTTYTSNSISDVTPHPAETRIEVKMPAIPIQTA